MTGKQHHHIYPNSNPNPNPNTYLRNNIPTKQHPVSDKASHAFVLYSIGGETQAWKPLWAKGMFR